MGMARTLKDMMLFNEGLAYLGQVSSVTLPTLSRKMEEWRGGGMGGVAEMDMGLEAMELKSSFGGPMRDILRQYGVTNVGGVYLRFAGAYQDDDTGTVDSVEVIVRGRHKEIEFGDQKVGEASEFSVTSSIVYYKLVWNGRTEIEIDVLAGIEMVDGVDRRAALRNAIGIY
ncbi:phage major tail tube protein [Sphingobium yanoikuyae]|uniref:phage major tail tube protein n=1 Tax=Sphingobium yanoikuyae TaxID=13690 RepID=UPI0022DCEEAC|nr:phage major tail tube protein [Sphingobium yanoikuyae]WBQ17846.1 phage major tail tube protein [Sphingobium yanoikuyae]